jgi:uncharacterized BrkB/YihY/UPF0761 family membrane protein
MSRSIAIGCSRSRPASCYGLLALFAAITALVSSYALIAEPQTIRDHLSFLAGVLPAGTFSVVEDQIARVLAKGEVKLGATFLFSFALALWSANGGMKAIIDALNVVYDEDEKRGFIKLNAVSLAFTLGGLILSPSWPRSDWWWLHRSYCRWSGWVPSGMFCFGLVVGRPSL